MIKSQYKEMLDVIDKDKYAMISIDTVCTNTGVQTIDYQKSEGYQYDENDVVLSSLLSLLGLVVIKLTFVYHGDDYHKVRYFFISKEDEAVIEDLVKTLKARR